MTEDETKEHWSTLSLGARMGTWVAGGLIGVPFALKLTGWLHGWDHPMAIDVPWWVILAPVWCAGPIFAAAVFGNQIDRQRKSEDVS